MQMNVKYSETNELNLDPMCKDYHAYDASASYDRR